MMQIQKPRKKKKKAELLFDAEKTFGGPEAAKDTDLELDLDSARYTAQQGQGGDRRA